MYMKKILLIPSLLTISLAPISLVSCGDKKPEVHKVQIDPSSDTENITISTPEIVLNQELVIGYKITNSNKELKVDGSNVIFDSTTLPLKDAATSYDNNEIVIPASKVTTYDITICLLTKDKEPIGTPLAATALETSTFRVVVEDPEDELPNLSYSFDNGIEWNLYSMPTIEGEGPVIEIPSGKTIMFKGNNPSGFEPISLSPDPKIIFRFTGKVSLSGNIMSLLDDGKCITTNIPCDACFVGLFSIWSYPELDIYKNSIVSAKDLILPDSNLSGAKYCYDRMFLNCQALEDAPELPATKLSYHCYLMMFSGCTSLNEMKIDYTGSFDIAYFMSWVLGVPETGGTFYYNGNDMTFGRNAIPGTGSNNHWDVVKF